MGPGCYQGALTSGGRFPETDKLPWESREEAGSGVRLSLPWAGFTVQINMTHLRMRLNKEILDKLF